MTRRLIICFLILNLARLAALGQTAPEKIDAEMNAKIRSEAGKNSSILRTVHFLSDVFSPRMTGTPQLKAAEEWAVQELEKYGLQNAHTEAWDFGSPGWANEQLDARAIEPFRESFFAKAMAWTPGTNGAIRAEAFNLIPPVKPSSEELNAYFETIKKQVRGKIVLTGKMFVPPIDFTAPELRLSDDEIKKTFAPDKPRSVPNPTPPPDVIRLTPLQVTDEIDRFLKANGAVLRVYDAREPHGVIRTIINRTRDVSKFLPTVIMRNEDYGRIARVLADGEDTPVTLEFNIVNRLFPEGRTQFNVIAEIPGTGKRDELVMLGAHLDAHHLSTGATDNAAGCAIMMEAVRILEILKIKPRRTIRIGLWTGEEQHVLGSQAYVREHFGSAENPKPDFYKLSAYLNLDTGSGRIRGMRPFGPAEAGEVLRQITQPFTDLGIAGASTYSNRTSPGSDHAAFSVNGLPGVYIDQDPLEYGEFTWHTNLDAYERISDLDAKQAAVVIASTVYHLAMRDSLLPRFTKEQMPPPNYFPAPTPATATSPVPLPTKKGQRNE